MVLLLKMKIVCNICSCVYTLQDGHEGSVVKHSKLKYSPVSQAKKKCSSDLDKSPVTGSCVLQWQNFLLSLLFTGANCFAHSDL